MVLEFRQNKKAIKLAKSPFLFPGPQWIVLRHFSRLWTLQFILSSGLQIDDKYGAISE